MFEPRHRKAWPAPAANVVGAATTEPDVALTVKVVIAAVLEKRAMEPVYADVHEGSVTVNVDRVPDGCMISVSTPEAIVTVLPVVGAEYAQEASTSCCAWLR